MRQFSKTAYTLFAVFLAAVSCSRQEPDPVQETAASLTFSVGLPKISLGTKAVPVTADESEYGKIISDPFGADLTGWTDAQKLIDARQFYRLTLFLVDKENGRLTGYRDLYLGSPDMKRGTDGNGDAIDAEGDNGWHDGTTVLTGEKYGTRAVVTFNYDHPLHKAEDGSSLECLSRGPFRIIAVANWAETEIEAADGTVSVWPGLTNHDGNRLLTYVESIISQFNEQNSGAGSRKFSEYDDYHNLMDYTLFSSNSDFLCPLNVQPLVLVKDVELQPGINRISGQMKRTWSRVRVTVENVSKESLTVHSLSFGDNTTRNESFLFYAPDREAATLAGPSHSHTCSGAPAVSAEPKTEDNSYNALVAFTPGTVLGAWNTDSNRKILFDGYILETDGDGKEFTYNIDLEYADKKVMEIQRVQNEDGSWAVNMSDPDDIEEYSIGEDGFRHGLYVIQNQSGEYRVLRKGTSQLETELIYKYFPDRMMVFSPDQVFGFTAERNADGTIQTETVTTEQSGEKEYPLYKIRTYDRHDAGYWFGTPRRDRNIQLIPTKDQATVFLVRNDGINNAHTDRIRLSFQSKTANEQNSYDFINVYGNIKDQDKIRGWNENDAGSHFILHKVEEVLKEAQYSGAVTLSVIDPETSVSKPLEAIRRNDFINIYITASYNEYSGEVMFSVKDWTEVSGEIEFN